MAGWITTDQLDCGLSGSQIKIDQLSTEFNALVFKNMLFDIHLRIQEVTPGKIYET